MFLRRCGIAGALLALVVFVGCGRKDTSSFAVEMADDAGVGIATAPQSFKASGAAAESKMTSRRVSADSMEAPLIAEAGSAQSYERKLIRNGDLSLQVQSLADTRSETESWVKAFGGYIANSSESSSSLSITVRIPADRFDEAMNQASGMGKLQSKNINSSDVTEQFYDLQNRIGTKRILLERYQNYLRQATKMNDILDVEARINEVTAELESMQGRMNLLSSQIDFSTISIWASLPPKQTEQGFVLPDTRSQFLSFVGTIASFFNGLLVVVLYIVIFGIPLVLLAAAFWWLCFGKLGLVRRLFARLSRRG